MAGVTTRLQGWLAYLLLHRDVPLPRQQLACLFWPDSTEAQARTNLRQQWHNFKQTLPEAEHFVQADAQTLQWRAEAPTHLDVATFEAALERAAAAQQRADTAAEHSALEQAVTAYRGDLLPGCYDDWLLPERERLRQAFTGALERLVALLESQDDLRAAIRCSERLVRHDPLREETYRALMRLHAAVGDRAGVVRIFHTCVTVLERELAVEPSAATREAYEQALKMDVPARAGRPPPPPPARGNLPAPLTSFIGRERELADVKHLLAATRLLTLTGPGGTGKTRLALHLATDVQQTFAAGAWLVELAPLADPGLVVQTVAATLGVREQPGRALRDALLDYVQGKNLLLILDNCEHLIETVAQLADGLLREAPGLRILASSREALGIAGETAYRVPSLPLPPRHPASADALGQNDCVRLFVDRAAANYPSFRLKEKNAPAIADICRRLDGIPLAIELAAARAKVFSPEQIAARLDDRFRLLTGGSRAALPRHQTLRALIDWSYELLPEGERALLRRLSTFAGGWSFEAAQAVGSDGLGEELLDLLTHLVDKSLVVVGEEADEGRYHLLETIRQYARDKLLESGEAAAVRERHLAFFLRLAEEAEPKLRGPEQLAWLGRLEAELDNLRTALAWALESGQTDGALRLASTLFYAWELWGAWSEGQRWLDDALAPAEREPGAKPAAGEPGKPDAAATARRAKALYAAARMHYLMLDFEGWHTLGEASLRLWRELGDAWWIAVTLELLGVHSLFTGDLPTAQACFEEGVRLARQVDDPWPLVMCLVRLSNIYMRTDMPAVRPLLDEAVATARRVGDRTLLGAVRLTLAATSLTEGDLIAAARVADEAVAELSGTRGNLYGLIALLLSVVIACFQRDPARADGYRVRILAIGRETGNPIASMFVLFASGAVAGVRGQPERSVRLLAAAEGWAGRHGLRLNLMGGPIPLMLNGLLEIARAQLDPATFEATRAAGRQMAREQAVALATEDEPNAP